MRHILAVISRVCHCEAKPKQSLFLTSIIIILLFFPSISLAETKEIISEGTYNMGDGETPSVAESRALLQAKRTALEQAGTYVESYTKVENLQLTKDEIQVLASGIMEVEILDKKRTVVGDGILFWVKIKAKVNPDKIEEMAKRVKEKSVIEDYKKIQEAYNKSQREIEELKKQLAGAKGEKEKKQVEAKITDEERLLQANEWFDKGYEYGLNKDYDKAIEAYTKAITLNPNDAAAYNNRGTLSLYGKEKGQHDRAIEDYNKAIALDPNLAEAYTNRGIVYANKGQYDRAIEDYNKAIAIDPNYDEAYSARAVVYSEMRQYDMAIKNFNKAITLNPNHANIYVGLGFAYLGKRNNKKGISNLQKACDMGDEVGCKSLQRALEKR